MESEKNACNHWTIDNLCYIMVSRGDMRKGLENEGIRVFSPYYGDKIPLRVFREICFRVPFFPKSIWYRKDVLAFDFNYINLIDVNLTRHYLQWIQDKFKNAQINYLYNNMVGKANNIEPRQIPEGIRVWTYDDYDARTYNIRLFTHYGVSNVTKSTKQNAEYDVFFVGKDKGRGQRLLDLEKKMTEDLHLKTKFIITKDGPIAKKKKYHQNPIPFEKVIEYVYKSKAILNLTMENQEGTTQRDIIAVTSGTKLITDNANIKNKDLYHKNNVFILGENDFDSLPEFLSMETIDIWSNIQSQHTFEAFLDEITG